MIAAFLAALQFLVISPAFIRRPFTPRELGRSVGFYPAVGLLLGLALAGLDWLLGWVFPLPLRTGLILTAWVGLTGALHLDGFLDAADGLLGGFTPAKRLEIMRDERRGAYALAGGFLLLLVQYSALNALGPLRFTALALVPVLGRWSIAWTLVRFAYARPTGLGKDIKDHARLPQALLASLTAGLAAAAAWIGPAGPAAGAAALAAFLAAAAVVRFTLRRIPGLTGDIYGAVCILSEAAALLAFAAWVHLYV